PGLQRLPHHARPSLRGHQNARRFRVPEPGIWPAALGLCVRLRRRGWLDAYQGRALPVALRQSSRRPLRLLARLSVAAAMSIMGPKQTECARGRARVEDGMSDKIYEIPADWPKRAFISEAEYKKMYASSL